MPGNVRSLSGQHDIRQNVSVLDYNLRVFDDKLPVRDRRSILANVALTSFRRFPVHVQLDPEHGHVRVLLNRGYLQPFRNLNLKVHVRTTMAPVMPMMSMVTVMTTTAVLIPATVRSVVSMSKYDANREEASKQDYQLDFHFAVRSNSITDCYY
uniref:(northern house mosquito) hypothetical protein n=1 Tax=Culex pipiens TaxID=7175 RepID=A0A8D8G0U1_CULPI